MIEALMQCWAMVSVGTITLFFADLLVTFLEDHYG